MEDVSEVSVETITLMSVLWRSEARISLLYFLSCSYISFSEDVHFELQLTPVPKHAVPLLDRGFGCCPSQPLPSPDFSDPHCCLCFPHPLQLLSQCLVFSQPLVLRLLDAAVSRVHYVDHHDVRLVSRHHLTRILAHSFQTTFWRCLKPSLSLISSTICRRYTSFYQQTAKPSIR